MFKPKYYILIMLQTFIFCVLAETWIFIFSLQFEQLLLPSITKKLYITSSPIRCVSRSTISLVPWGWGLANADEFWLSCKSKIVKRCRTLRGEGGSYSRKMHIRNCWTPPMLDLYLCHLHGFRKSDFKTNTIFWCRNHGSISCDIEIIVHNFSKRWDLFRASFTYFR